MRVVVAMLAFAGCAAEPEISCVEVESVVTGDGCADAVECCSATDCWWEIEGEALACDGDDCTAVRNEWTTGYCDLPKRADPPKRP